MPEQPVEHPDFARDATRRTHLANERTYHPNSRTGSGFASARWMHIASAIVRVRGEQWTRLVRRATSVSA
jgi:hypothetical protein